MTADPRHLVIATCHYDITKKQCPSYPAVIPPTVQKGAISVAFVSPSVYLSVVYMANNSRTQRPSVPKFGMKVPHHTCDSHTSLKVKWSKARVTDGWGHTVSAKPCGQRWGRNGNLVRA